MGFTNFTVVLEPHQPTYYPGQQVTGYVEVVAEAEVACKGIKVSFKGKCFVHWSENKHHYIAEEKYFHQHTCLWHGPESGNTMSRGNYKLPFSFLLPQAIPSSFESRIGSVHYQVKAEAERSWSINQTSKAKVNVNSIYDLNHDTYSKAPLRIETEKTACCCCCAAGPISLNMVAARSGYVPGEFIVVDGEVANHSNSTIKHTEVKIMQKITYITKNKSLEQVKTVLHAHRPRIPAGQRDRWEAVSLRIPPVPASHLQHCNLIEIDYILRLTAGLGPCKQVSADNKIIIGDVPLSETYSSFMPSSFSYSAQPGGTILTHIPL